MMNSPTPSTPSSGDSPPQMPTELPAALQATTATGPSPNNAKRRLPSSSVPYGASNRRRREESIKEEREREREREGERSLADVELMKYLNSIIRDPFDENLDDHSQHPMSGNKTRRGSVLSSLLRTDKARVKTDRAARQSLDHEQLREAAARSTGLHSILPDLDDEHNTLKRRPAGIDLRQLAREEAEAKLCGEHPPPLPTVPVFPCAQSALAAHTQLSGPLLKHQTPNTLARLVGSKAWKSRHGVFCTYALRNCSCAQPHRASTHSCDSATRTLACLHLFATPTPDALELARLIVTEDSVVFVVEPTLAPDDSRRGPRDLDGRKGVFQVQGISGAPQPTSDRSSRLSRRRDSIGANTVKSGLSHRPHTVANLALPSSSSSNLLGLDDDSRVHAVWFLQCPDPDSRQQWVSCIKRAVLLQRAERAGFGGTIHFTSPRSVTDPVPSGDLDVVLAMRAQAHRGSTVPYASPPVTPMTSTFAPTAHFAPVPSSNAFVTSPVSPLSPASDTSHVDAISLAFTRSQTPNYAPSVRTTHTAPVSHSKTRSRSSTVTAPVQALRGFFSRPPSRSASVAATKRVRTSSGNGPSPNHLASFTGVHEPTNVYPLGTPISAGLGSIDLSSCATTMDEPIGTPGLGPSTLPGLGPTGLPTPNKPPLSAPVSKGPASLPPPPRAKRAGSVSHVLHRGDETVRGREDEEGVRRPSLVPMLSLSFGRGDDLDRGQSELARMQSDRVDSDLDLRRADEPPPRVLPPMLAPPSSPLPVPPGPGASRSSLQLQLPGVGVHATGSALALGFHPSGSTLALPLPPVNIPPASLPQPKPQHAAALSLPSLSPSSVPPAPRALSGLPPPHPPTLALRTVGSIPILPGSWPIAPNPHSASDLTETTPSAITPSDVYQSFSNDAYGFSPYRASMTSDTFRISIHSDAYQAVSPTSEMYLTANEPPSALTSGPGGSYMNLVGSSSNVNLPVGSTSHLAISTSHLATTSTSHLDTTSSSHLDLSDTTPHASSTPFTTTASDSSQASVYSVKVGRSSLDAFRSGLGSGSDTFRSSSSDVFRSNVSDVFRSNASDVFRSNSSDVFRSNGNGATAHSRVSLAFGRGVLHEHPEADAWEGDYHSGRGSYGSRDYAGSARDYAGSTRDYAGSTRDYAGSTRDYTGSTRDYAHSGSGKEYSSAYTQSINVRESPTRTVATSYRDREGSTRDRDPDSAPSSPSSQAENYAGPTGGLFSPPRDTFAVRRDTFGVTPRDSFASSYIVPDDAAHPFSSASPAQTPVKSAAPSPARRSHRRAGSYAGPTLYTIASGSFSFDRRQSQRAKPELPPAAPPPSVPLPPTPATSRPSTPLSRPRTPSRQSTKTPPVPPLPAPARSSLRTRLRMLSTPSTPEPVPRELGPPHEEDLAQPISRVPIQLLVMEDSIQRAASGHDTSREVHGGLGIGLPPPPRTRPMAIRQHSYSASVSASDREGSSEGRRSDESGKRFGGARDSAVHLEHRD
ncbi:unnamed protein product [Rhizoctonia solani]|uniref:PH domain-containing protein n=1 Tax=Rhizoctonia solani TaxID=456999 RepID=A0A8H2Y0Q4_9AGAM|nr:unnamed protein product [Rhizoctonia solani]